MGPSAGTLPTLAELRRTRLYSEELGIQLLRRSEREYFKWFLASLLFGGRISETIAKHTYQAFARQRLLTPERILRAGWDHLVDSVMSEGGYVRYDESKSRQILRDCETLLERYGGSLARLHREAQDAADLEARLQRFYGVGPVTANIFLRELRPIWRKADPEPLPRVLSAARQAGIELRELDRHTMTFTRIEAGLLRMLHTRGRASRRAHRSQSSTATLEEAPCVNTSIAVRTFASSRSTPPTSPAIARGAARSWTSCARRRSSAAAWASPSATC